MIIENLETISEKKPTKQSLTNWIKNHWEIMVIIIMVGSLLILTICSIIQLIYIIKIWKRG